MRTRQVILGALALTVGLCGPAWAIWDGINPHAPIMPSWTQEGIDRQEQLRELTPEERSRLDRMPAAEREQALRMMRPHHPRATEGGRKGPMRQPAGSEEGGEGQTEEGGDGGAKDMRQAPESGGEVDESAPEQGGEGSMIQQEVELKPVPKQDRQPTEGQSTMPDHPIDAARAHIGMAHTSVKAQDWEGARDHVRQAEASLDRIAATGNRAVDRYLTTLKDDMRRAEQAIGNRSRDAEVHLEQLDSRLRNMRAEER